MSECPTGRRTDCWPTKGAVGRQGQSSPLHSAVCGGRAGETGTGGNVGREGLAQASPHFVVPTVCLYVGSARDRLK